MELRAGLEPATNCLQNRRSTFELPKHMAQRGRLGLPCQRIARGLLTLTVSLIFLFSKVGRWFNRDRHRRFTRPRSDLWSFEQDSNLQPTAYKTDALPIELSKHVVRVVRFERTTSCSQNKHPTTELHPDCNLRRAGNGST